MTLESFLSQQYSIAAVAVAFIVILIILVLKFFDARVWDMNGRLAPGPQSNLFFPNIYECILRNRSLRRATLGLWEEFVNKNYGKVDFMATNFFGAAVIFIWDPELVILSGHYSHFPKSRKYERVKFIFGEGLVTAEGEHWQMHRRIINPGFHFEALKNIHKIFNNYTLERISLWKEALKRSQLNGQNSLKACFDEDIPNLTLSIICESAFGFQLSSMPNNKLLHSFRFINDEIINRLNHPTDSWYRLFPSRVNKTNQAVNDLITPLLEVVNIRKKNRSEMSAEELNEIIFNPKDLVDILLNASVDGNYNLSNTEIKDHTLTFFTAGFDTTSAALSWIFYEIMNKHDVLLKCYEEVDTVFADLPKDSGLPYDKIQQLVYLNQVIKETLRLHPPAPAIGRLSKVDTQIGEYKFPAGTVFALIVPGVHRNPQYWDNPNEFIPERFSPDNQKKIHPFQYIPFSAGPRNCIGQRFAILEITVILALILRNFNISMDEEDKTNLKYEEVLVAHLKGLKVNLCERV